MLYSQPDNGTLSRIQGTACVFCTTLLVLFAIGCGSDTNTAGTTPNPPATPTQGPQTYFAPNVAGTTNGLVRLTGPKIFAIDDFANLFSQSTFGLNLPQQGPQVINAGCFLSGTHCTQSVATAGQRGLLSLGISTNYTVGSTGVYAPTNYNPPKTGSFAVQLAGQAGGLVQLAGQPVDPIVAAVQCPTLTAPQTYQFLTIPGALIDSSSAGQKIGFWDPRTETAYGSVDIGSSGSSISFGNIQQHTLPSVGGSGTTAQQPVSPVAGTCAPTVFGTTITVGQLAATNPGAPSNSTTPIQASVAIGPTGLLLEHNGNGDGSAFPGTAPALFYDNTLGAGTGAIGLPKPSSAVDAGSFVGAQYLGFVYGAGTYQGGSSSPTGWSSHLASFGFSTTPSSCASIAASTGTMIYGGDFTGDDPSTSKDGFGNCDLAIDLGAQDSANNGLFPKATVWLGGQYLANTTKKTYSLPAVAIAGQLNGKSAIFILGVDSTQPWAVYLLQSN
ncbi:MAG: hypothetical protein JWM43_942 [Acidobacteriaceae bacterium]|nr:hypothetical protein [Acidobacteriaceae bacterium]